MAHEALVLEKGGDDGPGVLLRKGGKVTWARRRGIGRPAPRAPHVAAGGGRGRPGSAAARRRRAAPRRRGRRTALLLSPG